MYRITTSLLVVLFASTMGLAQIDTVEMVDDAFVPADITVQEGDTVLWINMGNNVHTTTSGTNCEEDGIWNSGNLNSGEGYGVVFSDAGDYPYYCIPHCAIGMTGSVTVEFPSATKAITVDHNIIHPNPAVDQIWIDLSAFDGQEVHLEFINANGQLVQRIENMQTVEQQRISVADLQNGVYFLKIKDADGIVGTQRFLKTQ